jgi:VWFA-related protein
MPHRIAAIITALILAAGAGPRGQPQSDSQIVLHSTAQEVLLDLIARDKHQKLVTNLRPEDIEILEDGVPQTLRSFQYRNGHEETAGQDAPAQARPASGRRYTALGQINVVSLLFEGLGVGSRPQAIQAARDFLASEVGPDTYIGVFALNQRLTLLQQYTNNIDLLNRAVDKAAAGPYLQSAKDTVGAFGSSSRPRESGMQEPGSAEERIASEGDQARGQMRELSESIMDYEGHLSIDALQQLIRAQAQVPGRKTVVYFSEGLILPPNFPERYRALVSLANRANVAFYTVESSGLSTQLAVPMPRPGSRGGGVPLATGKDNMRYLAEDTGGFAIADTNDVRVPMRRLMEEVRAHYEAAYAPSSTNYDGHFRIIEVRVRRPGVQLQSRKGYFALPILGGDAVEPFEMAGLAALDTKPLPHAFDFHSGVLAFHAEDGETECRAVFSVPGRSLHFTEDSHAKLFHLHATFLALVKDEQNQVVRKISRDLPFQAPAGRRAEFERGEVTVILPLRLAPGRYRVEAAVNDVDGGTASTGRVSFVAPPAEAETRVALSDLVLVRSVQPAEEDRDNMNPLEFPGGKVTPEMNSTIVKSRGAAEGVYFILYPGRDAKPDVRIAISRNGELMSSARPDLPPAEADGSYRVWSRIPFGGLDPGVYEIRVTVAQGGATARRTMAIEVRAVEAQ